MRNKKNERWYLDRLEKACHAGGQLMMENKITPAQYDALNEAIFNIESTILEDE